jgi:CheY-like chemotaxis protein
MKKSNRLRILYAEDNKDACDMLSALLGFSDIDVLPASSVKEAFQWAQDKYFDLYLLDSRFPDGSGLELCQQLREHYPQTPIVFYTADAFEWDRQKGLAAGANAYLVKPNVDTVAPTIFQLVTKTFQNMNDRGLLL